MRRSTWTKEAARARETAAEAGRQRKRDEKELARLMAAGDDPLGLTVLPSRAQMKMSRYQAQTPYDQSHPPLLTSPANHSTRSLSYQSPYFQ